LILLALKGLNFAFTNYEDYSSRHLVLSAIVHAVNAYGNAGSYGIQKKELEHLFTLELNAMY